MNHCIILGNDVYGNITRIDNVLDNIAKKLEETEEKLDGVRNQLESAKIEVTKSFLKEKEFKEKTTRLLELDRLLNTTGQNFNEKIPEISEIDRERAITEGYTNVSKTEGRISLLQQLKKNNETVKYQETDSNIKTRVSQSVID